MTLPTFGVEEEFLLLDQVSGLPVWAADAVLERAGRHGPHCPESSLTREVLRCQVESATPICRSAGELQAHLRAARRRLAAAAEEQGTVLSPVGAAPLGEPRASITATDRYLAMHHAVPALLDEQLVNGMHVHVGVPTRAAGVDVLNRLRPLLHVLLALSANSPFWRGRDSGCASLARALVAQALTEGRLPFACPVRRRTHFGPRHGRPRTMGGATACSTSRRRGAAHPACDRHPPSSSRCVTE